MVGRVGGGGNSSSSGGGGVVIGEMISGAGSNSGSGGGGSGSGGGGGSGVGVWRATRWCTLYQRGGRVSGRNRIFLWGKGRCRSPGGKDKRVDRGRSKSAEINYSARGAP